MNSLLTGLLVALLVAVIAGVAKAEPRASYRPAPPRIALQQRYQWKATSSNGNPRLTAIAAQTPAAVAQALNASKGPLARLNYEPAPKPTPTTVIAYNKLATSVLRYVQIRKDLDPAGQEHYVRTVQAAPLMAFHALGASVSFETK